MTPGKNVIADVNNTADKLFSGVNDTADKLLTGVSDTADKSFIDDKLYWRQRSILSANWDKLVISPAAEVGHGRRWCHWNCHEKLHPSATCTFDKRPLTPPKLLQTKQVIFSFGGPLIRICGVPMDSTFHNRSNYTIVDRVRLWRQKYHQYVPFNYLLSLAAPHLHGLLVLITGNKFIAGVVDTSKQLIAVSLTPVINTHSRISPRIFKIIWNRPNGILGSPGDNDLWKKPEVENLVSDSLLCCPEQLFPNTPRMYQTRCF